MFRPRASNSGRQSAASLEAPLLRAATGEQNAPFDIETSSPDWTTGLASNQNDLKDSSVAPVSAASCSARHLLNRCQRSVGGRLSRNCGSAAANAFAAAAMAARFHAP